MNLPDQFLVPGDGEAVGHAGNEVADRAQTFKLATAAPPSFRQQLQIGPVSPGQTRDDAFGLLAHLFELGRLVEPGIEEALQSPLLLGDLARESDQRASSRADLVERRYTGIGHTPRGFGQNVADHAADHIAHQSALALVVRYGRMALANRLPVPGDDRLRDQLVEIENSR